MIRHASIREIPDAAAIINGCAEYGLMLHRSHSYLYEHVRDFHVALEGDRVIGVCGLGVVWANLAELYALAVAPEARGRGLGRQLVEACVEEARALGIPRVFCLTYEKPFFQRMGFAVVDRQRLPLKVWSECVRCLKNQSCDEIAMVRPIAGVPEHDVPQPTAPPDDQYIVPVPLTVGQARQQQRMSQGP